jgi:hypothetical protein
LALLVGTSFGTVEVHFIDWFVPRREEEKHDRGALQRAEERYRYAFVFKIVSHAIENLFVVRMDVGIIRYARPKLEYILSHAASRFS